MLTKLIGALLLMNAGIAFSDTASTYNGTYQVTEYRWCNGPQTDVTRPGGCSVFGWHQVDLDRIVAVEVNFNETAKFLKISDDAGNSWERDLAECVDFPLLQVGQCNLGIDELNESYVDLDITEKQGRNDPNQSIHVRFEGEELRIFDVQHALIVFKIEAVR